MDNTPSGPVDVLDPRIGILCREGRTVYYVIDESGDVNEATCVEDLDATLRARTRDESLATVARKFGMRRSARQVSTWFWRLGQITVYIHAYFDRRGRSIFLVNATARGRFQRTVRTYNTQQAHRVLRSALARCGGAK